MARYPPWGTTRRATLRFDWRRGMALATLIVALAAVACGDDSTSTPATSAGAVSPASSAAPAYALAADQTFRVNLGAEPSTLDPSKAAFSIELSVIQSLFRGPFRFDA